MGKLTTHVLDTAHGCPAAGLAIRLFDSSHKLLVETVTNSDGRVDGPLLEGEAFKRGRYTLEFEAGAYFRARGVQLAEVPFLDMVPLAFGIEDAGAHYHVPLLVSPYAYSTYRGS
ncbi:hydroxyisourate hydrolase [bacterium SCN 62-11]|nr:hydroxyisourate hydrolase [Candidatus Eremiobacteraeota bacterium]ODT56115.1 MAG: hydroxyisourate hydrolase [bacterium SCN 62-11]